MPETSVPELVDIADFEKLQLKIAKILAAESLEKSNKLIKLTVSTGDKTKTILSGIRKYYKPEELIGKKVVIIDNLKPAKMLGIDSQGMILAAAENGEKLSLLVLDKDLAEGSSIS